MQKVIDEQEEAVSEPDVCVISVLQYQVCILTNLLKFIILKRTMGLMMNRFFLIVYLKYFYIYGYSQLIFR